MCGAPCVGFSGCSAPANNVNYATRRIARLGGAVCVFWGGHASGAYLRQSTRTHTYIYKLRGGDKREIESKGAPTRDCRQDGRRADGLRRCPVAAVSMNCRARR